jgi:hypothetical protein
MANAATSDVQVYITQGRVPGGGRAQLVVEARSARRASQIWKRQYMGLGAVDVFHVRLTGRELPHVPHGSATDFVGSFDVDPWADVD